MVRSGGQKASLNALFSETLDQHVDGLCSMKTTQTLYRVICLADNSSVALPYKSVKRNSIAFRFVLSWRVRSTNN